MGTPIRLAFLWHMHQPGYLDLEETTLELPWVRMHSSKAYFDMAWLLERYPSVHCTINFVPILIEQIRHYLDGMRDEYFLLTEKPSSQLNDTDKKVLLEKFFSCHFDTCVATRPRYLELFQKAQRPNAHADYSTQDYRDLAVLFNLSWFGYGTRVEFPLIRQLEEKGKGFTEEEKIKVLDLQIAALRRLFPMYRKLRERGQVEISTTPYHHPILPLLIDTEVMQRCMPDSPRPHPFQFPNDAHRQVELAISSYEQTFGEPPKGIWPAEGSVSPEALTLFESAGLSWAVTDEAILWRSLGQEAHSRDQLYRPYSFNEGQISVFFRDRDLSDAVGFRYARMNTHDAVNSFINQVRAAHPSNGTDAPLVVVALDGENPWEYYPNNGLNFLTALYEQLTSQDDLQTVRLCDSIHLYETHHLEQLATGSWIDGNFGVWIGGETENKAWTLLGNARRAFGKAMDSVSADIKEKAERMLLRAESSDWFWWYGDRFTSADDADFDALFRGLIKGAYETLGIKVPADVYKPLVASDRGHELIQPIALISPDFTRPKTAMIAWSDAGHCSPSAGSMALGTRHFREIRFGFSAKTFCFRISVDPSVQSRPPSALEFFSNHESILSIPIHQTDASTDATDKSFARFVESAIEGFIPLSNPCFKHGEHIHLSFTIHIDENTSERVPLQGELQTEVPDHLYTARNWTI